MEVTAFENFMEGARIFVNGLADSGQKVYIAPVLKNNGVSYHGLVIKDSVFNVSPTLYLEYYYNKYLNGTPLLEVYYEMWKYYKEYQPEHNFDVSNFLEFEKLKKRLVMRLVNTKRNEELLKNVPYVSFLDLSIIFYCAIEDYDEYATILIQNGHMNLWNVTVHDLYEIAMENSPKILPCSIFDIKLWMEENSGDSLSFMDEGEILVLTNSIKIHGATCMVYPDVIENIAKKLGSNFFMIPNSLHEIIIMPEAFVTGRYNVQELNELVVFINGESRAEEEMLSDHVYYFNGEEIVIPE